ncbi:MAG TPA: 1,6-anhydro-N-acetylmuramyl-L-alanine amidase AmpD [Steroidobacteraceae bacterium]|nr:1,6-anhydro-N-acetylmuramyl-L-alanine amidase AmpD [Steroidobacteraceae bacterium]
MTSQPHQRMARGLFERIDLARGLLLDALYIPSPNYDARPEGMRPELIVVHGISLPPGEFGGPWIEALFSNRLPADVHPYFATIASLRVSSHLLIRRSGEIVQFVPFSQRAWHAGQSSYEGRERCNDFSIGIELEGADDVAYEPEQYRSLTDAVIALCDAYASLSLERIAGHSDISPGRKTDPGASFDWVRFRAMLRSQEAKR